MASVDDQPYGVKILVEGVDPAIDLVAVHGVDGHQENTWLADGGALWLRDFLPKEIPNARILAFGYDSRTSSSSPLSCQKLHDHATSLITELNLYRKTTETTQRPIIFIAHCSGGIIVKDALIHSNSANESNLESHNSIKTSTYGILFFGTPHQGSDIRTFTRDLAAAVSLKNKNQDILKNLERDSELLQKQIGQYNHISSQFVTKCFYETYRSTSRSRQSIAVTPDSARIPGATNIEVFPIHSDHQGMVRYKSQKDEGFKKVSLCLHLMVADAPEKVSQNWQQWKRIKAANGNGIQTTFEIPHEPEYPRNQNFTGRQDILDKLHQTTQGAQSKPVTVALYGIGGVGKTQVASEYAHAYQEEYKSIFWINAASRESVEIGFRKAAQRLVREHANISYDQKPNYALIAQRLGMVGAVDENGSISEHESHIESIITGVKLWLAKKENNSWLLIIDNFDDPEKLSIKTFSPAAAHGTIIMTSRRTDWVSFIIGLEVETMDGEEGESLLLKSAALSNDPDSGEVVRRLGRLPLAVVQAGAYVAVQKMTFKRYLEIYEKCFNDVFGKKPPEGTWNYEETVRTTWEISFKAIKEVNEKAAELLSLCSFISNENIRDDMLRRGKQLGQYDLTLDHILGLLFSYSLAQRKGLYDSFYIHPLVHLWAHKRLDESDCIKKTKEVVQLIKNAIYYERSKTLARWEYEGKILPHILTAGKNIKKYLGTKLIDCFTGDGINQIANVFVNRGYLEKAELLAQRLLEARESTLGKKHSATLTAMSNLGFIYAQQGRYEKAEELQTQVLEASKIVQGKNHQETFISMDNLAATYHLQKRYDEAEKLQTQVLEASRSVLGKEHPETTRCMNNLATTYLAQKRHKEAEELQNQILEARKSTIGKEHQETLIRMGNLAPVLPQQGRPREVEESHTQVLEAMKGNLDKEHPDTLAVMSNLVSTYSMQERYEEAEELGIQVLEASKGILGKEHPKTLKMMRKLGDIYSKQERYKEEAEIHIQALEVMKGTASGEEHIDILASMEYIALAYFKQRQYKESEELRTKVLEVSKSVLGKENKNTVRCMGNLAATYFAQGRQKEAEDLQTQVLETMQSTLCKDSTGIITAMHNLDAIKRAGNRINTAECQLLNLMKVPGAEDLGPELQISFEHFRNGRDEEAIGLVKQIADKYAQRSLPNVIEMNLQQDKSCEYSGGEGEELREDDLNALAAVDYLAQALGEGNPETLLAMLGLSIDFSNRGMWKQAETLGLRLVDATQNTLGKENPATLQAMFNLAVTYIKQGRLNEAEELQLQVVQAMKCTLGEDHPNTRQATKQLQVIRWKQGRWKEEVGSTGETQETEEEMLQRAMAMSLHQDNTGEASREGGRKSGNKHSDTLKIIANQAATYWDLGKLEESEKLELQVMKFRQKVLGNKHQSTLLVMNNLAATYGDQGRFEEAEALQRQVMEALQRALGNEHSDTLEAMMSLAETYKNQERWKETEELTLQVVRTMARNLGKEHPRTLSAMASLATNHWYQGDLEKAEKIELRVVEGRRKILGNENPGTLRAISNLAATYASKDRYEDAEKLQEEVLKVLVRTRGESHSDTMLARELIQVYREGRSRIQEVEDIPEQTCGLWGEISTRIKASFVRAILQEFRAFTE